MNAPERVWIAGQTVYGETTHHLAIRDTEYIRADIYEELRSQFVELKTDIGKVRDREGELLARLPQPVDRT